MIDFPTFKASVLRFIEQCGVGGGIADEAAWEAAGCPPVRSAQAARFVVASAPRVKSLSERLADNDWAFASTPGGGESLEGGHSAVEALHRLGELDRFSPANRRAWVEYFNRYQDEATGYYLGPYVPPREHASWRNPVACSHPWDHMHDHLVSSLCPTLMLLEGQSRFPLSRGSQTGRFLDRAYLEHYLTGRDWNVYRGDGNYRRHDPWWIGNEFWFPACMLWQISVWEAGTPAAVQARRLLDEVWYPWHDRNFACNGFWAGDLDGDPARLWHGSLPPGCLPEKLETPEELRWSAMTIMGGAHQLWFYDFDNHPIPEAVRRAQTDAVLALQNRNDGHFGMGDVDNPAAWACNCTDVDCLTVLAMNYHRQDYRRAEIAAAAERGARAVLSDRINAAGVLESELGKPFTHHLVGRISDFFYEQHRRMFEACEGFIDVAQVTDDLGSQTGPLISMDMYREFYAPHHKRFIDLCHEFGIKVFHHDDGSCRPFLPLLVEMGIDILNPVQWTCPGMDLAELKAEFGDRVCFHGAIENQRILPFGTPEEVRAEVRHCMDELAGNGTGYILAPCHNLQVNTPVENIIAMYDEAWRYGRMEARHVT